MPFDSAQGTSPRFVFGAYPELVEVVYTERAFDFARAKAKRVEVCSILELVRTFFGAPMAGGARESRTDL